MTTDDNPADDNSDVLDRATASELLLGTLYGSVSKLLANPSKFTDPQELLIDLLSKYHYTHAVLEQFLLIARILRNFDQCTKQQLTLELYHATKAAKKQIGEWINLTSITNPPQDAPR